MSDEQKQVFDTLTELLRQVGDIVEGQKWSAAFVMDIGEKDYFLCKGNPNTLVGLMLRHGAKLSASIQWTKSEEVTAE